MTKEEKEILKRLKKEKNYDEIFKLFGQKQFVKSVSTEYREQDINKLKKEGKYEDIYLRYGESQYNRLLNEAKQREIEEAYGKRSAKAIGNKIKNRIKSVFGALLIGTGMLSGAGTLAVGTAIAESEQLKNEEKIKYEEVIKDYEDGIKEYAENIKAMGLTDLETFMKLQADMHNSIKGYGTPSLDIFGYEGVDMGLENGMGVCRNMANDIMNKLNAINPEYNARCITVYAGEGVVYTQGIKKNTIEETRKDSKVNEMLTTKILRRALNRDKTNKIICNHMVVAVDLKNENETLIIDPTSSCLSVFKDGKITILNAVKEKNPFNMNRTPVGEILFRGKDALKIPAEYIKSFLNPNTGIEELKERYSVEAQRKALDSAKEKELKYIYSLSKRNFRNSMKVDLREQEEKIYSIEEIQNLYNKLMSKASSITNKEEAIEIANAYRKITCDVLTSIEYYNKKQEEIIGKPVNEYAKVGNELNMELSNDLRHEIAKKMVETDAVNLPIVDESKKEFLCDAYLQTEPKKQLQDLKVVFDKIHGYYILDDKDNFLLTIKFGYMEDTKTECEIIDKDTAELYLKMAKPVVKGNEKNNNKEIIDER